MAQKEISVITPVWNRADITLNYLVHNWRLYEGKPVEFIIIDNGSKDGTGYLLDSWREKSGDLLTVIHNETNHGFGPACNQGAWLAQADKLLFLNNDVIIRGDYLSPIIDALEADPRALVGAELMTADTGWNVFDGETITYMHGWCVGMTCAAFCDLGGFDERYVPGDYEDLDLSYTAKKKGYHLTELSLPIFHIAAQTAETQIGIAERREITERHRLKFAQKWGFNGYIKEPDHETSQIPTS